MLGLLGCQSSPSESTSAHSKSEDSEPLQIMLCSDPFAVVAIPQASQELRTRSGTTFEIENLRYDDLHTLICKQAASSPDQLPDIISFDVVWLGEITAMNALTALDDAIANTPGYDLTDLTSAPLKDCQFGGETFGIPIQPHSELLWYRSDWFSEAGLAPPVTTDDILAAARHFHNPDKGVYGICWNAQRGQPLGQTMAHLYATFGGSLLDADGKPNLNTDAGRAAAEFARELLAFSPPDIHLMAWDQRTSRFAEGLSAMTYGWTARSYLVENSDYSRVAGKVGYAAPPVATGLTSVAPLGTWALGVPAGLPPERRQRAIDFLLFLTAPDQLRLLAESGSGGIARVSLIEDAGLQQTHPPFSTLAELNRTGALSSHMRPAIPQWHMLCQVMGEIYADMLNGTITPAEATALAQQQAIALW